MVTDLRRAAVPEVRDHRGLVTFALGMVLVGVGIAGFLAVGSGEWTGVFRATMPLSILHVAMGAALVSAASSARIRHGSPPPGPDSRCWRWVSPAWPA